MDSRRFDRLTAKFARRATRRQALLSGTIGLAAFGHSHRMRSLAAQDATPAASPAAEEAGPTFLFVQLAEAGRWAPKPGDVDVFLLTLSGVGTRTLYFSDRPDRIVGTVPTGQFLDGLGFTPFAPPNAAVVVETLDGAQDTLVVELFNPTYTEGFGENEGEGSVTYEAKVLNAYQGEGLQAWVAAADDDRLPEAFGQASLFIDDCADLEGCFFRGSFLSPRKPGAYVGPIPGGPYGRCYSWSDVKCIPCSGQPNSYYDGLCNMAYAECRQFPCYTDTCGAIGLC